MLFLFITAMPLASANPISIEQVVNSQLNFIYIAIIFLAVALTDLAIYLIRKKSINKHNFLHVLTLFLLISLLLFYSRILTSGFHRINGLSSNLVTNSFIMFGYITMVVTLGAIADSAIYLIRRRNKLTSKQSFL